MKPARRGLAAACLLGLLVLGAGRAQAHATSTGLVLLSGEGATFDYRLTVLTGDLPAEVAERFDRATGGDRDAAGQIAEALQRHVALAADGRPCRPGRFAIAGSGRGDGRVDLDLRFRCPATPARLHLRDDLADWFGAHYRSIVSVQGGGGGGETVLDGEHREATMALDVVDRGGLGGFVQLGVVHILSGFDHLAFLLALLVGSRSLWGLLGIATAFTLAHSITLSLAALQLVTLPAGLVEPAIAASIVWVAAENLLRRPEARQRWPVAFLFGLVHGFGFAGALAELQLSGWRLGQALLGFNLGVEAGQAAVLLLLSPIVLWAARQTWQATARRTVSLLVALAGAYWFVARVLAG